ncbi:MAG: hypothetical protein H0T51_09925 [Pirellulales bacterium]|nr:hypothetical protein [Pirellulales bacterium]
MRRLSTFFFGMVAGGLLIYAALNYHLIQAKDGLHLIPKVDATLACTYADIRNFGPSDWAQHPEIAMALFKADRSDLLESAASSTLETGLDRLLAPNTKQ